MWQCFIEEKTFRGPSIRVFMASFRVKIFQPKRGVGETFFKKNDAPLAGGYSGGLVRRGGSVVVAAGRRRPVGGGVAAAAGHKETAPCGRQEAVEGAGGNGCYFTKIFCPPAVT
jgi:hypothetical protein